MQMIQTKWPYLLPWVLFATTFLTSIILIVLLMRSKAIQLRDVAEAARVQNREALRALASRGQNINTTRDETGHTALTWATSGKIWQDVSTRRLIADFRADHVVASPNIATCRDDDNWLK
jgi:hypothetical protein